VRLNPVGFEYGSSTLITSLTSSISLVVLPVNSRRPVGDGAVAELKAAGDLDAVIPDDAVV
jgi:hypothetical protein